MRALVAGTLILSGCAFPSFGFGGADSGGDALGDSASMSDSAASDSAASDSAASDSAASDVSVTDAEDSSVPPKDSAVSDTLGLDTGSKGCTGSTHFFCDDFDKSAKLTDGWDGAGLTGGGMVGYETVVFVSGPRAFVARIVDTTAAVAAANLLKTFSVASASVTTRFEADVYLTSISHSKSVVLLKLQTASSGGKGVGIIVTPTGFSVEVIGTTYKTYPLPNPAVSKWVHLRFDVVLKQSNGSFALTVDGVSYASMTGISTADADGLSRQVSLGLYANQTPVTAYDIRYDDVTIDNL